MTTKKRPVPLKPIHGIVFMAIGVAMGVAFMAYTSTDDGIIVSGKRIQLGEDVYQCRVVQDVKVDVK